MADKTSTYQTSYQGCGNTSGRGFCRGLSNLYSRGQSCGFNPTKFKVLVQFEALGSDVHLIRDARQTDK